MKGMLKKVVIVGEGGHSKVIRDIILAQQEYEVIAVLDDKYQCLKKERIYYGPISSIEVLLEKEFFQLVIAIGDNEIRKRIVEEIQLDDSFYGTFIYPTAVISESAQIGYGTVVMPNAVINADARIGNHVIVNTAAVIEHDNVISNFVHVSPKAALTGTVTVKEGTHIGAGAVVIPGMTIGEWSIIGAGSTVVRDIPSYCTAIGTPAKVMKNMIKTGGRSK